MPYAGRLNWLPLHRSRIAGWWCDMMWWWLALDYVRFIRSLSECSDLPLTLPSFEAICWAWMPRLKTCELGLRWDSLAFLQIWALKSFVNFVNLHDPGVGKCESMQGRCVTFASLWCLNNLCCGSISWLWLSWLFGSRCIKSFPYCLQEAIFQKASNSNARVGASSFLSGGIHRGGLRFWVLLHGGGPKSGQRYGLFLRPHAALHPDHQQGHARVSATSTPSLWVFLWVHVFINVAVGCEYL